MKKTGEKNDCKKLKHQGKEKKREIEFSIKSNVSEKLLCEISIRRILNMLH